MRGRLVPRPAIRSCSFRSPRPLVLKPSGRGASDSVSCLAIGRPRLSDDDALRRGADARRSKGDQRRERLSRSICERARAPRSASIAAKRSPIRRRKSPRGERAAVHSPPGARFAGADFSPNANRRAPGNFARRGSARRRRACRVRTERPSDFTRRSAPSAAARSACRSTRARTGRCFAAPASKRAPAADWRSAPGLFTRTHCAPTDDSA